MKWLCECTMLVQMQKPFCRKVNLMPDNSDSMAKYNAPLFVMLSTSTTAQIHCVDRKFYALIMLIVRLSLCLSECVSWTLSKFACNKDLNPKNVPRLSFFYTILSHFSHFRLSCNLLHFSLGYLYPLFNRTIFKIHFIHIIYVMYLCMPWNVQCNYKIAFIFCIFAPLSVSNANYDILFIFFVFVNEFAMGLERIMCIVHRIEWKTESVDNPQKPHKCRKSHTTNREDCRNYKAKFFAQLNTPHAKW